MMLAGAWFGARVINKHQKKTKPVYDVEIFESRDASSRRRQVFENMSGDVMRPCPPCEPFRRWEDVRPGMVVEHRCIPLAMTSRSMHAYVRNFAWSGCTGQTDCCFVAL
jgi:hypothetical protein